jgi:dipeptidyl aminopeptidase/acylaminoacyl peptidase
MHRLIAVFLSLTLSPLLFAAEAAERGGLSAKVLWDLQRAGAPVAAPDGSQLVVPLTAYDADTNEGETRLWRLSTSPDVAPRPLTVEGFSASEPVFSPDGSQLAFISKRGSDESKDDAGQIYLLPMSGPGEARRLTTIPTGVKGLRWEGEYLYFISEVWPGLSWDAMAEQLQLQADGQVSARVWDAMPYAYFDHYLDEARAHHLFRIPAAGGQVENVTGSTDLALMRNTTGASHYDVSPDGQRIALVADSNVGEVYRNADVYLLTLPDGDVERATVSNLTQDNPAADSGPRFSPDGKQLAFTRQRIEGFYGDQGKLMLHALADGSTRMLHESWDRGLSSMVWAADSMGLYAPVDDRGTRRIYYLPLADGEPQALTANGDFGNLDMAGDGTLFAANQSALYPVRIGTVNTDTGAFTRLDDFNDAVLADVDAGSYESVSYKGHDGVDIQMWVHYPPGFDRSKSYPLMLLIHGGPHGAITDNFHYRWNAQTFASWGYVTAWPNFHGSSGFGQAFVDSINPDWISKPYADVIAAAEYLAEQDYIDSERMVAAGGSYGGYLSSILLGRPHPFKTLVIHAAVYDFYAQMSGDFAVNMHRFGPYWENPALYQQQSPHSYADNFNTPSLIIHGQKDLRVPVGQGFELYRTLQTRGVESRLVYYPDENHWVLKRGNSLHWYAQVRDWIGRFAKPGPR